MFLDQLTATLKNEEGAAQSETSEDSPSDIGTAAAIHGGELMAKGFTIEQVVHDYGDLCQAVTELAGEKKARITVDEFRVLNRCLDNAIAEAVTAFGSRDNQRLRDEGTQALTERMGFLAHELRNLLNTATLAFQAIKSGAVAVTGATGAALDRSLIGLRNVIDRSLAEVRLSAGLELHSERLSIADFLREAKVSAALEAESKRIAFTVSSIDDALLVDADRHLLGSAVSNLLQNAFKFTRRNGRVSLVARADANRVLIEVEDECGGLPEGAAERMFAPFDQQGEDRTGLGLGLSISRRAVEAIGGSLRVRDLPGHGCIFTIELPRASQLPSD